jgi:hypothetical protein
VNILDQNFDNFDWDYLVVVADMVAVDIVVDVVVVDMVVVDIVVDMMAVDVGKQI